LEYQDFIHPDSRGMKLMTFASSVLLLMLKVPNDIVLSYSHGQA